MSDFPNRTKRIATSTVKVACINWGIEDDPAHWPVARALVYLLDTEGEMVPFSESYWETWAQGVEQSTRLAAIVRKAAAQRAAGGKTHAASS